MSVDKFLVKWWGQALWISYTRLHTHDSPGFPLLQLPDIATTPLGLPTPTAFERPNNRANPGALRGNDSSPTVP